MPSKTFTDKQTVIDADWLNDVNNTVFTTVPSNTSAIATNAANISTNDGRITAVEAELDSTGARYGEFRTADGSGGAAYGQRVWKDIIGTFIEDLSGPGKPAKASFIGNVGTWTFAAGEEIDFMYHIPHDYAVGTDIYLHVHWGHNGTNISGNLVWDIEATIGQRVDSADVLAGSANYSAFSSAITTAVNSNTLSGTMNITKFPRYCHVVEEIQLSSSTPSASQIDTADISVDGIIQVSISPSTIPTITGGSPNEPFLFTVDVHYQADMEGTKNKDPDFYT